MKILVLSDSHSGTSFMRLAIRKTEPDICIHLGDYYDDGQTMAEEFPAIRFLQVPGNCDRFRCQPNLPAVIRCKLADVPFFLTHGHMHAVKSGPALLEKAAREAGAAIVLYGHTHNADCRQEPDGLWVLNPGSCGSYGGSVGIIQLDTGKILSCSILRADDLVAL